MLEVKDFIESKGQMGNEFSYKQASLEKRFLKSCIELKFSVKLFLV